MKFTETSFQLQPLNIMKKQVWNILKPMRGHSQQFSLCPEWRPIDAVERDNATKHLTWQPASRDKSADAMDGPTSGETAAKASAEIDDCLMWLNIWHMNAELILHVHVQKALFVRWYNMIHK